MAAESRWKGSLGSAAMLALATSPSGAAEVVRLNSTAWARSDL